LGIDDNNNQIYFEHVAIFFSFFAGFAKMSRYTIPERTFIVKTLYESNKTPLLSQEHLQKSL